MKTLFTKVKHFTFLSIGLGVGLSILGGVVAPANADVIRTGANGNTATTNRTVADGALIRTTTGSNGNSGSTVTTQDENGTFVRTATGPNGRSATSTHDVTVESGQITRESIGARGNGWSVIRAR
ncbi:MAG: hypothetical protein AAF921_28575 [Cyanobacteria bacterium P01_D01_bin.44]